MKRIFYIIALVFSMIFFLGSCEKNPSGSGAAENLDISGEWRLKTVSSIEQQEGLSVYVDFNQESGFTLFQKVGEGRYRYYTGMYNVEVDILEGTYSDGHPFASKYKVRKEKSGKRLVLVPLSGESVEREYDATPIPAEVRTEAVPYLIKHYNLHNSKDNDNSSDINNNYSNSFPYVL